MNLLKGIAAWLILSSKKPKDLLNAVMTLLYFSIQLQGLQEHSIPLLPHQERYCREVLIQTHCTSPKGFSVQHVILRTEDRLLFSPRLLLIRGQKWMM